MANLANVEYQVYQCCGSDILHEIADKGSALLGKGMKEFLLALGAEEESLEGLSLRGVVTSVDACSKDGAVIIQADTAWDEQPDFVEALAELYGESVGVLWQCEEPGCRRYATNVEGGLYGEFVVEAYGEGEYYNTVEEAADAVRNAVERHGGFSEGDGHEEAFGTFEGLRDWCDTERCGDIMVERFVTV